MSRYTVGQAKALAFDFLGIKLPVTESALKTAYRSASRKLHPDFHKNDPAAEEKFKQMLEVYQFIIEISALPGVMVDEQSAANGDIFEWKRAQQSSDIPATVDGVYLLDLGLGLGPTKNGRDCPRCLHKGWVAESVFGITLCTHCVGGRKEMTITGPCRSCKATGKFTQARSGKVVSCLSCQGTGSKKVMHSARCPYCMGLGKSYGASGNVYHKCYECKGTGEIEIDNPVIPKGRLF